MLENVPLEVTLIMIISLKSTHPGKESKKKSKTNIIKHRVNAPKEINKEIKKRWQMNDEIDVVVFCD
jgi:hypothetical protein